MMKIVMKLPPFISVQSSVGPIVAFTLEYKGLQNTGSISTESLDIDFVLGMMLAFSFLSLDIALVEYQLRGEACTYYSIQYYIFF